MPPSIKIVPYHIKSRSARSLAEGLSASLGQKVWRVTETYYPRGDEYIINWGNSRIPYIVDLNARFGVTLATNKLLTLLRLSECGIPTVEWTNLKERAQVWRDVNPFIYARTKLDGHSGEGIQLVYPGDVLPDAPLYTKYFANQKEFRIHVFNDQVIDATRKRKRIGAFGNKLIRCHKTGYIYAREGVVIPDHVSQTAINAVRALQLDFGAVDVLYNKYTNHLAVLEVNTAPGLVGTTLDRYVTTITQLIRNRYLVELPDPFEEVFGG